MERASEEGWRGGGQVSHKKKTAIASCSVSRTAPRQEGMKTVHIKTRAAMLCCLALAFLVPIISAQNTRSCAGSCASIGNCPPLLNLLIEIRKGTAPRGSLNRLRSFVCGYDGSIPLVCCENTLPASTPRPFTTTSAVTTTSRNCGVSGTFDKIVGGENAKIGEWPWAALLFGRDRSGNTNFFCGGTLIDARYVLTAAHCQSPLIQLEYVRLGEHTVSKSQDCDRVTKECAPPAQNIRAEFIIHPDYQRSCPQCNDIALLRLERPATLDLYYVSPICLPINFDIDIRDKYGTAIGWGSTSTEFLVNRRADVLQKVLLRIHELQDCRERKSVYPDQNMVICAGGELGQDTCRGDSGGPIMLTNRGGSQHFVIGVTSSGPLACGSEGGQGLYTNVKYYLNWILSTMRSRN
ncbi:phenoloxidase-activating factor 3-like isoform X2 [Oratosquilla oratoria]|uniref:phenoloxidase-activating factor 3-like isoform X2 n=1 Tax=Oratosquilla oratoria TaxID=337810 RepID=UPI003F76A597